MPLSTFLFRGEKACFMRCDLAPALESARDEVKIHFGKSFLLMSIHLWQSEAGLVYLYYFREQDGSRLPLTHIAVASRTK